jgi:hypothetical protein
MENIKIQLIEKAWEVWNGEEYYEPIFHSFPVIVHAKTAGKAKTKAFSDVHYEYDEPEYKHLKVRRCKEKDIVIINGKKGERFPLLNDIEYQFQINKWRTETKAFVNKNPDCEVYIYSGEHGMFWRSNRNGYASKKEAAGIYKAADAWDAVAHCGLSKQIQLIKVN